MFDMLTGQYKNLASKGRYGDTMLAHINPEEAALLKSMGGAGTVNPQTGLPEFYGAYNTMYGLPFPEPEPLPVLAQVFQPNEFKEVAGQLQKVTVPQQGFGLGTRPAYETIDPELNQYANRTFSGMGTSKIEGYTVPTDLTFQGKPLEAKYDPKGNFVNVQLAGGEVLIPDPNQPNIAASPKFNKSGGIVDYGVFDLNQQDDGGFGSFIGGLVEDFGPMILAGLGANLGLSSGLFPGAGAASSGTGLSLGGSGLGLTGTAGTGLNLAATTGGGLGLTAGSAGAGVIGAGLGTTLGAINTGISSGAGAGVGTGTGVDYGLTTGGTGTGLTTGGGTGINIGGGTGLGTGLGTGGVTTGITGLIDAAVKNPSITGTVLGTVISALDEKNKPTSTTTTSSIDPQIKAEYLANLERAKATAAGLEARQIAQPGAMYTGAEQQLYNLGMTPFGASDIAKFYNPFQEQVVQGALGDIERTRQIQEQANMEQATRARAFGGSRQGVVSGMTNEAAIRQAATTGAQLRSAGFTQAANLGLAARPLDIAGLQTSLGLGTTRTALEQARLDALRNLGTERLGITSGALGLQPANVGGTTSQPLYSNTAGNLLSGGLTGAYIGSLLGKG